MDFKPPRIILHVDLDAFFVSCEILKNPELAGKPVVVGADPKGGKGRGVVNTASYEAREFGVRSGMPISVAYRICPNCIFIRPNFSLYEKVSSKVMKILRKHAVKFEQSGIDEAYLDVTGKVKDFEEAKEFAEKIKQEIYDKVKVTCSIGVAPNKVVAKIASDFKKPFFVTVVKPENVKSFLSRLPVRKLIGVGPKTEAKLKELNIETIGELANADVDLLLKNFGKWGIVMHQYANGIDESPVEESREIKSISRELTFEEDTSDLKILDDAIESLSKEIYNQLKEENFTFKTVTVKIRYENFETHTRAKTLQTKADRLDVIVSTAKKLFTDFYKTDRKIRLIGVRVSQLEVKRQETLE